MIKLYMKAPQPRKYELDAMLHLLQETCALSANAKASIVDVRRGKQYDATTFKPDMDIYLDMEAQSFLTLWNCSPVARCVRNLIL